jgi:hypothetical protein
MKHTLSISLGLSLIVTPMSWFLSSHHDSLAPVVAVAPSQLSNGQIIQIIGEVQLERSPGRVIRPTQGTRLYPGDKLLTASGAQVLVQCADLTLQSVPSGQNRGNVCPQATEQEECTPGTYKCPHRGDIAWNSNIPYIITPRRTALLTDKPTLRWNPVAGATSYTVNLQKNGEDFWETTVSTTEVVYSGETPLEPGASYSLIVTADTGDSSLDEQPRPGGLSFHILDENQAQRIRVAAEEITQKDWTDATKALAIANLYLKHDPTTPKNALIADAIATLEELVASKVETAAIYRTLGELYLDYLQLVQPAYQYYSKAVELADPNNTEELTAAQAGLRQVEQVLEEQ